MSDHPGDHGVTLNHGIGCPTCCGALNALVREIWTVPDTVQVLRSDLVALLDVADANDIWGDEKDRLRAAADQ